MTLNSLLLFIFVVYLLFNVGRSVYQNYNSNKDIEKEAAKLVGMEEEIHDMENRINYYQTYSFKEKEARAKLGYKAPGEKILSLPIDTMEDKISDSASMPMKVKETNCQLWLKYFFGQSS